MANPYFIKIELPDEGKESAMADTGSGSGNKNTTEGNTADKIAKAAKKMVSFSAVKATADQIISYRINTINLRTGATEYEQRMSAVYSAASQVVGAGAALAMGAMSGGIAGAAVVAIGLVSNGIHKVIEIEQRQETLRLNESLENISIGMQNVRAGTVGRRSSNQ